MSTRTSIDVYSPVFTLCREGMDGSVIAGLLGNQSPADYVRTMRANGDTDETATLALAEWLGGMIGGGYYLDEDMLIAACADEFGSLPRGTHIESFTAAEAHRQIVALGAEEVRPVINLYEDNAGGLYMHRVGDARIIYGLEQVTGANFAEDAANYDDWASEWTENPDTSWDAEEWLGRFEEQNCAVGDRIQLIATWYEGVVTVYNPSIAGTIYLTGDIKAE